jgi:acetyltransferase-like isoleucine patch superfamily enzyme
MARWFQRILRRISYIAPGGFSLRPALHRLRGVKIGKNVWISQYVYIDEIHPEAVSIGDNVSIGIGTLIIAHLYWGPVRSHGSAGPVTIESDVFIGPHCVILPGVKIGRGAVVQAGTVISREVPPGVFIGHQPPTPLAVITVPLTLGHTYGEFVGGLRPWRGKDGSREH